MTPTKKNPPFYFYQGKGWKVDTKIKVNGKYVKMSHGWYRTLSEARADYQRLVDEKNAKMANKQAKDYVSWKDFSDCFLDYRRTMIKGSSMLREKSRMRTVFDKLFNGLEAKDCFKRDMARLVQQTVKAQSINRANKNKLLSMYLNMLEFAFGRDYLEFDSDYKACKSEITMIRVNDEEEVIIPAKKEIVSDEGREKLLACIDNVVDKMLTITLFETGLRIGEALALTADDFDFDDMELSINKSLSVDELGERKIYNRTKSVRGIRKIPISKLLADCASEYIAAMSIGPSDLMFYQQRKDKPMDRSAYQKRLGSYCVKAGIPKIGPHSIRHTFATKLSELCTTDADRQARAYIMGHSVAVDEQIYTAHNQLTVAKKLIG